MTTTYRKHDWFDAKNHTVKYGVQGKIPGGVWLHCAEGSKPLLFDSEIERDAKLKELRTRK